MDFIPKSLSLPMVKGCKLPIHPWFLELPTHTFTSLGDSKPPSINWLKGKYFIKLNDTYIRYYTKSNGNRLQHGVKHVWMCVSGVQYGRWGLWVRLSKAAVTIHKWNENSPQIHPHKQTQTLLLSALESGGFCRSVIFPSHTQCLTRNHVGNWIEFPPMLLWLLLQRRKRDLMDWDCYYNIA